MTQIRIPSSVLFRDLGGEAVLLDLESGCYYGLDEIGTRIWSLLESHSDLDRLEEELCGEYDVGRENLRADLRTFVRTLTERGLLVSKDE